LGYETAVRTVSAGEIWEPLLSDPFVDVCRVVSMDEMVEDARRADLLIAVKVLPGSFGVARKVGKIANRPVLLDVDDPDIEATLLWNRPWVREMAKSAHFYRGELLGIAAQRLPARRYPTIVSNPVLQCMYGGHIVPHAREDIGVGADYDKSGSLTVAFVGTDRPHKGLDLLLEAVGGLNDRWELVVTQSAPFGARPGVHWVGPTDQQTGMRITKEADAIILPSRSFGYARGQVPMKLIDAMLAARPVAVSGVGPLPWVIGDAGMAFKPDSVAAIMQVMLRLEDVDLRSGLGSAAREEALKRFTPAACAPEFEKAVEAAAS
jgi:glycosyltransferase involved in cell wall biosynthesis